jgi:pimeloyl-ACP methyl ester carboxylesterase
VAKPLSPAELFPAGDKHIATRTLSLPTGVRVRIAEAGPPSAPPVIMLHGWGASLYAFSALTSSQSRVIAVDMRGYGLSDRPRGRGMYSTDAYLGDLKALYAALRVDRATLVGHSMGGGIALRYALAHPERVAALALVNPTNLCAVPIVSWVRLTPRRLVDRVVDGRVPRWLVGVILRRLAYGDATRVTERDVDEYWSPARMPGYVYAVRGAISEFDWQPLSPAEMGSLRVPSVVILGQSDRLLRDTREPAECLAGSTVHSLPAGHCVHEECPDQVYAILADFLRQSR